MPRPPASVGYPHPDISDVQQHPSAGNNNIPYPQQQPQPHLQQQPQATYPYPYQQFPTYPQPQGAFDPSQQQQQHHQPQHPHPSVVYQPAPPQAHPYASHPTHFYTATPPLEAFPQHLDSPQQQPFATHQAYLSPQQHQQQTPAISSPGVASSPVPQSSPVWTAQQQQLQQQQQQQQFYQFQQQQLHQQRQQQQAFAQAPSIDWQQSPQPPQSASGVSNVSNASPQPPAAPTVPTPAASQQAETASKLPRITLRVPRRGTDADDDDNMVGRRRTSGTASRGVSEESHGVRSTRHSGRRGRAVNYAEDEDDEDFEGQVPSEVEPEARASGRVTRRRAARGSLPDDDDEDADAAFEDDAEGEADEPSPVVGTRRSSRAHKPPNRYHGEDDFEESMMLDSSPVVKRAPPQAPPPAAPAVSGRRSTRRRIAVDPDEDDEPYAEPQPNGADVLPPPPAPDTAAELKALSQRSRSKRRGSEEDGDSFNPSESDAESSSATEAEALEDNFEEGDGDSFVSDDSPRPRRRARKSRPAPAPAPARRSTRTSRRADPDSDGEYGARRNLRKRDSRPNYQLPPLDISAELAANDALNKAIAAASGPGRGPGRRGPSSFGPAGRFGAMGNGIKPLPWSMKGRDFAQAMGDPDSSDSDNDLAMPGAAAAAGAAGPAALGGAAGARGGPGIPGPTDVPNFGRVNPKSNMADADPLGVDTNVTFDRVGGLDGHINQLKEMVALPLLYPELFQQFSITPPRGVLFHGPPGTGKTLLARALAASCSNGNQKIAFFMRKGADVLSKWVGEAERQLRMLFEEARASQPSIIFFDEIDGLAPVRSSKQDQIHASLVSTLLALMDGMDGRGQVIVIGATNRPDAVDPALRRPGRFDREFYFPLPNRDARRQIIGINTRDWEPALPNDMLDTLATLTKGYGGADLRALCTEAALNAIQRKYPQIYKTTDRLLVKPGSVRVQPKDFMLAVKKIVPSSARSSSSAAVQLPNQLVPLLSHDLDRLKAAVDLALPQVKKRTALEEAEFVDEDGDSFDKEMMLQSLDKLRTYRPRLLVYGPTGNGQMYLGPAILHHLEGFHVQSFDLATLMGDSTRTPEAAIVQMFVEAKRHQPSIIFIPSLAQWAETLSETARSTTRALLDGISPSDPVLLLAIVDGPLDTLPPDVRAWFGFGEENRIELSTPNADQRAEFFEGLLEAVRRVPTDFPDGVPRKKRVLEELPLAPALPPRQPTAVEVQRELERDAAARNMLLVSFTSLIQEFWRKYRRPVEIVRDEAAAYSNYLAEQAAAGMPPPPEVQPATQEPTNGVHGVVPGVMETQVTDAPQAMVMAQLDPTVTATGDVSVPAVPEVPSVPAVPELPSAPIVPVVTEASAIVPGTQEGPGESLATNATVATDVTTATNATAATVPPPTWQVHNMDLAIIKHKLVKHKYYTPQDVLDDFALIEENAKHTMDADRQLKVSEMVAHARMHVQGFDPKWTPEFERYAVRMRERKADRAKAKALSRAATRSGSRASDGAVAAPAAAPAGDTNGPGDVNSVGKRPRDGEDDADNDRAKRHRENGENGMDVDQEPGPLDSSDIGPAPSQTDKAASQAPPSPTQVSVAEKTEDVAPSNGAEGDDRAGATDTAVVDGTAGASAPASVHRTPTPPPVYPPFVCPESEVDALRRALKVSTRDLNVDELEQLRASLLDRVWRARGNWDRTQLVDDMRRATDRFVREVQVVRDAEAM